MNYFSFILFIVLVIPVALKEYHKDKGKNIKAKIVNFLVVFFLFNIYTNSARKELNFIIDNFYGSNLDVIIQTRFLSPIVDIVTRCIYLILCVIISGNAVLLAWRKSYARTFMLKLLPFWWFFEGLHMYKYIHHAIQVNTDFYLILFVSVFVGVFLLGVYFLYVSNLMKQFFKV